MPTNIAAPPDLTLRFNAVIIRLRTATIGTFTVDELELVKWAFQIAAKPGPYTLAKTHGIDGWPLMHDVRDPLAEQNRLEQLEGLADKAGV